jgi:hypothetical protein
MVDSTLDPDLAMLSFDNGTCQVQPKAKPLLFPTKAVIDAIKAFENP